MTVSTPYSETIQQTLEQLIPNWHYTGHMDDLDQHLPERTLEVTTRLLLEYTAIASLLAGTVPLLQCTMADDLLAQSLTIFIEALELERGWIKIVDDSGDWHIVSEHSTPDDPFTAIDHALYANLWQCTGSPPEPIISLNTLHFPPDAARIAPEPSPVRQVFMLPLSADGVIYAVLYADTRRLSPRLYSKVMYMICQETGPLFGTLLRCLPDTPAVITPHTTHRRTLPQLPEIVTTQVDCTGK